MTARIEWRTRGKGEDALLLVREYGEAGDTVMKSWSGNPQRIASFLNDMSAIDTSGEQLESDVDKRDPRHWGDLVLARARDGGDVLAIDPEIYWDQIYYWFRRRGVDPHPWHRREPAGAHSGS